MITRPLQIFKLVTLLAQSIKLGIIQYTKLITRLEIIGTIHTFNKS